MKIRLPVGAHCVVALLALASAANGQTPSTWTQAQEPFVIYGNTYYVGSRGLTALLITSDQGHVLIDGALPASATAIADNIRKLGFRVEDVKLILNSHAHFDHAGGIASLRKMSNAQVTASEWSAKVLRTGLASADDPQYGQLPPMEAIPAVNVVRDREALKVGELRLTAHLTPGHTPGGTSWTWRSCEGRRCVDMVYADSLNPISAKGFRYTARTAGALSGAQQLQRSFAKLESLPCEILIVPHPELIDLFGKFAKRQQGSRDAFMDRNGCRSYVQAAREKLTARISQEEAAVQ